MAKKETTNDDLAMMVQNGFLEMDKKFEKRFKEQDKKFDGLNKKIDNLRSEIKEIKSDISKLKKSIAQLTTLSLKNVFQSEFTMLKKRVEALEKQKQPV